MSINSADNRSSVKVSRASSYLSSEENDLVFRLVGRRSVSQCTTVAQLYQTEGPTHSRWIKKFTGALCFIKDNAKRSYYCRMYCLLRHEMVWEHEMYDTIDIARTRPYLLTFEGQDGIVALNFAFEEEADTFLRCAKTTVANRNRRREERRTRGGTKREPPARPPPITSNKTIDDGAVTLRNPASITKLAPPQVQPSYQQQSIFNNSKNKKRDGVKKLTKADIGTPLDFKHVTHVGWNAKSGFDLSGEDEALRPFLAKAGVSGDQLKDRQTRDFIYDFIQSNNIEEIVRKETRTKPAAPPVPPTRNQNQNGEKDKAAHRHAPPPPPPPKDFSEQQKPQRERQPAPPLPTSTPPVRSTPTRPPPMHQQSSHTPPPPPPPPMMPPPPPMPVDDRSVTDKPSGPRLPVVPDTRNALMDSIRKGAQLKKVEAPAFTENKSDLLSEIRSGFELRPVGDRPVANRSSGDGAGTDALADALRKALELRKMKVTESSSSESEQVSDDGEWSD